MPNNSEMTNTTLIIQQAKIEESDSDSDFGDYGDDDDGGWEWQSPYNNLYLAPMVRHPHRKSHRHKRKSRNLLDPPVVNSVATLFEQTQSQRWGVAP